MTDSNTPLILAWFPASKGGLSFRGTEVNLFDLAYFSEKLLGNKSIICLHKGSFNEPSVLEKFAKTFTSFIWFENTSDLERQLLEQKVDAFYTIRGGMKEEPMLEKIPMLVHAVYDMSEKHGLVYAGVSESVANKFGRPEYVPHMINLPDADGDFRDILGISENAIVFGRHGGNDTWDLSFAKETLLKVLNDREDIYFLFAVRPHILRDVSHPRLICLEAFSDLNIKRKFINTFDGFLHAQSLGESFGLSCGEASRANKPVIVWDGGALREHLRILGDKCIKYKNADELYTILTTFNRDEIQKKDWKAYGDYTPEKVMTLFSNVFLDPLRKHIAIKQSKESN